MTLQLTSSSSMIATKHRTNRTLLKSKTTLTQRIEEQRIRDSLKVTKEKNQPKIIVSTIIR